MVDGASELFAHIDPPELPTGIFPKHKRDAGTGESIHIY